MAAPESQEGTAVQGTQRVLGTVCEQLQGSMALGLVVEAQQEEEARKAEQEQLRRQRTRRRQM
jgi:hypothetical protein